MTRKIKTKQLIHTFLFLLSLLLRGLKVPNKAGGSQVSQGEATQDYLPLENTSSWKIWRKTVLWLQFVSLSSVSHLGNISMGTWRVLGQGQLQAGSQGHLVAVTWTSQLRKLHGNGCQEGWRD